MYHNTIPYIVLCMLTLLYCFTHSNNGLGCLVSEEDGHNASEYFLRKPREFRHKESDLRYGTQDEKKHQPYPNYCTPLQVGDFKHL